MARYRPWVQYTTEIATSKNLKKNWIRCRWGNIQRKKKRVQIYNIQKEYFISTKLLWSGTFRQQKQETWGNRFTCETKKETSENQYQNMARPLPDYSGPSRWKTSDQIQAQAKDDVQCGRFILEIDNPITEQDICQAIRKLKSGKASGLNNISSKLELDQYSRSLKLSCVSQIIFMWLTSNLCMFIIMYMAL